MKHETVFSLKTKEITKFTLSGSPDSSLTPFILIDFPIHIDTISTNSSILYFKGSQIEISRFFLLSANSADPDRQGHYLFVGIQNEKGKGQSFNKAISIIAQVLHK